MIYDEARESTTAVIEDLRSSGVWVRLPDQRRAWLPAAEMIPDYVPHDDMRRRIKDLVGSTIKVCVFRDETYVHRGLLVSHLRATNDPWLDVYKWTDGEIKLITVTLLTQKRALGRVPPGVRAELLLEDIKSALQHPWNEFGIPLPGDEVAGRFYKRNIHEQQRLVTIDFIGYVKGPVSISDILVAESRSKLVPVDTREANSKDSRPPPFPALDFRSVKRILVVDDDLDLLTFTKYALEDFEVYTSATEEEALSLIHDETSAFDLAILDLHLSNGIHAFEGLSIGRALQVAQPRCHIVIITGAEIDAEHRQRLSGAGFDISDVILKPLGTEGLYRALRASVVQNRWENEIHEASSDQQVATSAKGDASFEEPLQGVLDAARSANQADGIVLFSIHPVSDDVQIVAFAGDRQRFGVRKAKLPLSPVRDAAIDDEQILTGNATSLDAFPKHRWLQRAFGYESCMGLPVHMGFAHALAYSLFAFHSDQGRFREREMEIFRLTVLAVQAALRSQVLTDERRKVKPFELSGKLYGRMGHELTRVLDNDLLLNTLAESLDASELETARRTLSRLSSRIHTACDIVRTFRSTALQQHDSCEEFQLHSALTAIVRELPRTVEGERIFTSLVPYSGQDGVVFMRRTGLRLLLENLFENAAQQILLLQLRKDPGKPEILVAFSLTHEQDGVFGTIHISDNGPGIHRRDFERVFDLLFTTKPQGYGMGLDICRMIARDVRVGVARGDVLVKRSVLLSGSVFEVKLPIKRLVA